VVGAGRNATGAIDAEAAAAAGVSGCAGSRLGTDIRQERDMDTKAQEAKAAVGDVIVIAGHRVGEHERSGEILELLGEPSHRRYRVRWEDGHESVFTPGSDATIRHATRPRTTKRRRAS
jgi:hypothetical protein